MITITGLGASYSTAAANTSTAPAPSGAFTPPLVLVLPTLSTLNVTMLQALLFKKAGEVKLADQVAAAMAAKLTGWEGYTAQDKTNAVASANEAKARHYEYDQIYGALQAALLRLSEEQQAAAATAARVAAEVAAAAVAKLAAEVATADAQRRAAADVQAAADAARRVEQQAREVVASVAPIPAGSTTSPGVPGAGPRVEPGPIAPAPSAPDDFSWKPWAIGAGAIALGAGIFGLAYRRRQGGAPAPRAAMAGLRGMRRPGSKRGLAGAKLARQHEAQAAVDAANAAHEALTEYRNGDFRKRKGVTERQLIKAARARDVAMREWHLSHGDGAEAREYGYQIELHDRDLAKLPLGARRWR